MNFSLQRIASPLVSFGRFRTTSVVYSSFPECKEYKNECIDTLKSRLVYQSRKRGMLENGLLLSSFAAKFLSKMSEKQLRQYDELINKPSNDWDIYYWATGVKPTPLEYENEIMQMLKDHATNPNKECRIRQPELYEHT